MPRCQSPLLAAAALLVAGMQVGCAGPGRAVTTLDGDLATSCTPADEEGRAVFGISGMRNASVSTAEVTDVQLVDADGMELIGFELRPMDDEDAHVVGLDYDRFGPSAVVLPHEMAGGEEVVTLVGVRVAPGTSGSADAIALSFRGDDGAGEARTLVAMQVVPAGEACDVIG